MHRYIVFLRAINVSGHNIIKMQALRAMWQLPGIDNIKTYIQSGNVVLDAKEADIKKLSAKLARPLKQHTGNDIELMILTLPELQQAIDANPMSKVPEGYMLYITFLSAIPGKELVQKLEGMSNAVDTFKVQGKVVYALVDKKAPKSQFSNMFIEKHLKQPATGRNLNTIEKMLALANS